MGAQFDARRYCRPCHPRQGNRRHHNATQRIELTFPNGTFEATAVSASVDWALDVAILEICPDTYPRLPPPLAVGAVGEFLAGNSIVDWWCWGFPQGINSHGFAVCGTVVADGLRVGHGATVIQLSVDQSGSDKMGGMSGAPVVVQGHCVGLIRQYPPGLTQGTLYAASVADAASTLPPLAEALRQQQRVLPNDVQNLIETQVRWAESLRALDLQGTTRQTPYIFVEPTLADKDEMHVDMPYVGKLFNASTGVIVRGGPGAGKTRFVAEFARRVARTPESIGIAGRAVPILLNAIDLIRSHDFFGAMTSQRRFPQPFIDAERLRELTQSGRLQWIFLVDAIDEATVDAQTTEALSNYLRSLDTFCAQHGHKWLATQRDQGCDIVLPEGVEVLRLDQWSESQSIEFIRHSMGGSATTEAVQVFHSLPSLIWRNPLLLNAAVQLCKRNLNELEVSSSITVLSRFLDAVLQDAQERYLSANRGSFLRQVLERHTLIDAIAVLAMTDVSQKNAVDEMANSLDQACNLGIYTASKVAAEIATKLLPVTGVANVVDDEVQWGHLLYRDALIAIASANTCRDIADLHGLINTAVRTRNYDALAMALILISRRMSIVEVFDQLEEVESPPLMVRFLCLGGKLDKDNTLALVQWLRHHANEEKHLLRTCPHVLSNAFSPIEGLMSLCFLPIACDALQDLVSDLLIDAEFRKRILARISEQHMA